MTQATKSQTLPVRLERIPSCLKESPRWVGWRWKFNPDKPGGHHRGWDKPLLNPKTGKLASSTDPETWGTYEEAVSFMSRDSLDGIGFNLLGYKSTVVHDLDNCRNPETGEISPQAMNVVRLVSGYWKITPSGTGIRGISWGQKTGPRVEASKGGPIDGAQYDGSRGRYVTLTGQTLSDSTADICDAHPGGIEAAYVLMFPALVRETGPAPTPTDVDIDDAALLERAGRATNGAKFNRLWAGDTSDYSGDDSAADQALCNHLTFWTGEDAPRVDHLFRQSGLMRPKWDEQRGERTYGQMTIAKALEGATEHYSPSGQHVNGHHAPERPEADNAWRYPGSEQDESISFSMPAQPKWPEPIAPEAFYGLAGDVVRAIEPHTEADPASLLLNFLAMYGNAVGFEPHAVAEAARHGGNLNVCVVGETSKGRKGSSTGRIQDLFFRADPMWAETHIQHGGLSSGEGLIWAVRDPIEKLMKDRKSKEYTKEVIDEGVEDKRLLIVESEFANTLKVMGREGNSLSPILRQAWDSGNLSTLTKNSPARATQAHISVIGHITKEELTRYLSETESANGFANRFLWCCSRRAQALPEGGGVPSFGGLVEHLHNSLELGRKTGLMERDEVAKEAWAVVYPELSEGKGGMFGVIIGRSEAQVLRLSLVYALLDASRVIQLPHLKAALAVWEYCEASAQYIFGDATGDVVADQILESLRQSPEGLDRTQISALIGRNLSLNRINHALGLLLRTKQARFKKVVPESGQGRPREVWRAVR